MGTTPNYAWPYPELTDPPDGPAQMKALALAIDTSMKNVGMPPVCAVRQTVVQSIPNNVAAYTGLTFNVDEIDPLDMHTGSGSRMTVKVAGVYRLAGGVCFAGNVNGVRRAGWWLNDVNVNHAVTVLPSATPSTAMVLLAPPLLLALSLNDWIELRVFQDTGAALNTAIGSGNQSWASMEWIRP